MSERTDKSSQNQILKTYFADASNMADHIAETYLNEYTASLGITGPTAYTDYINLKQASENIILNKRKGGIEEKAIIGKDNNNRTQRAVSTDENQDTNLFDERMKDISPEEGMEAMLYDKIEEFNMQILDKIYNGCSSYEEHNILAADFAIQEY